MILQRIKKSYIHARRYVERCCIKVIQDGKEIQAFTECEGKMRVTDWGGTSSAIYLLNQIGSSSSPDIIEKIEKAKEWLISDQKQDGSWEAAEMQCCEATSAVIFDLHKTDLLSKDKTERAIEFIQSCYRKQGYFLSGPNIHQTPHLYTTYLAAKTLSVLNHNSFTDVQKKEIINWIKLSKSTDGKWGPTSQCIEGDVAHTVFALLTFIYCGIPINEIKKEYRKQIKWLQRQIKTCSTLNGSFSYEATEAYDSTKSDKYGECAYILKSYHFNTALMCYLFLKLGKLAIAQRLIDKMIKLRGQQDGWGLNTENKIFVWATQQAIDCMYEFENTIFTKKNPILSRLRSLTYYVPYFYVKIIMILVLLPVTHWLLYGADKGADIIVAIIVTIVPWIIKTED